MPKLSYPDTQSLLAGFLSVSFIGVVVLLVFHPLPDGPTAAMVNTLTGFLGGMATSVATYYFGSSKGSASKDDTINSMIAKPPPAKTE